MTIIPCISYSQSRFLVRWLSGRKQRFAKAPYPKRVPRVRIPPSPRSTFRETPLIRGRNLLPWCDPKDRQTYRYRFSETFLSRIVTRTAHPRSPDRTHRTRKLSKSLSPPKTQSQSGGREGLPSSRGMAETESTRK